MKNRKDRRKQMNFKLCFFCKKPSDDYNHCDNCEEKYICEVCACKNELFYNWYSRGNNYPTYCPDCLNVIKNTDEHFYNILQK